MYLQDYYNFVFGKVITLQKNNDIYESTLSTGLYYTSSLYLPVNYNILHNHYHNGNLFKLNSLHVVYMKYTQ